ncbi:FtsH protease activity modulator HflK [Meridianimarinicoccus aquatilis]|uniref:Protein HflK n=1 Tax=Meridianimarinicoccus aquatilis TaxID=2552766 RepID=A0A4V3BA42_9RHOB|nr:FtsH protease activity modulator HflK [Fluviibacterium aquatile]QIE42438.1 FtsH protease activity modulator HflK [Rhodobacteraceae bacterium SC52]TDL81729.1 FtsH protease activity modulator HflK [Fluviibacterium aquatile]
MAGNNGGPWGGGGNRPTGGNGGGGDNRGGGRKPGNGETPQMPEIDDLVRKGQEQLKVLMGGRGKGGGRGPGGGGGPSLNRGTIGVAALAAFGLWVFSSLYTVRPEEQSVELFLGKYSSTGQPGLNFAPWPLVKAEVIPVTREQSEAIGTGRGALDSGLMLTTDANIVDIEFQVVWNINDPAAFLFNLADPQATVRSVAESAMREIIAQSQLSPILNRDRGLIEASAQDLIQTTLQSYESGINVIRVNLDQADPPEEVIDAFREVQAAEQERDRLERQADAYANRVLAGARGEAAQILEEAEAYRAETINAAQGEASRFTAVLGEYALAPEVTRKRLYLETMETVLGDMDKIILDNAGGEGSQGVVPYLPLNELRRSQQTEGN